MHPILKTVLAVMAGIVVAMFAAVLAESLGTKFYPAKYMNPTIEEREEMIRSAPFMAEIIFIAGFAFSSFFGAYLAARIAPGNKKMIAGLFVGFFMLLCGLVLFIAIKHPLWLAICTCICFILFSWLAVKAATFRDR